MLCLWLSSVNYTPSNNTHRIFFLLDRIFICLFFLNLRRGSLLNTAIFMYAVTSPVNGFFGGSLYARTGGKLWIKQMVIGALLIPGCVSVTAFFINFIAIYYQAAKAIHFTSMVNPFL